LVALERNAAAEPSALIEGSSLCPSAWLPLLSTLRRLVVPVWRSCTDTSAGPLVSPETRLVAHADREVADAWVVKGRTSIA
jgi:hypothetical protein